MLDLDNHSLKFIMKLSQILLVLEGDEEIWSKRITFIYSTSKWGDFINLLMLFSILMYILMNLFVCSEEVGVSFTFGIVELF